MSEVATVQTESPEVWSRLENSPQWAALTDSQRVWVTQFIATGSALLATKAGYHAKSETNARVLSYELSKNKSIVAALDVAAGKIIAVKSEREILIATVRKQLRAAEKGSIAASKFTAQLERLEIGIKMGPHEFADEPEEESPSVTAQAFPIGSIIVQDGKRYEVKAEEIE
jgi:hypothetical protein